MDTHDAAPRPLALVLCLAAAHSAAVGLGLILIPADLLPRFGLAATTEPFFRVQAGVFHFVMVLVYLMAASRARRAPGLVLLSLVAKVTATVFLLTYYFLVHGAWMILASGLGDGAFAIAIYAAAARARRT